MPLNYSTERGQAALRLSGELDHHEAMKLMAEIGEILETGLPTAIFIDLSGLTFMDSSGIAVIVQTFRTARAIGARLEVLNTPERAMRIFSAAGIDKLISFR